MKKAEVHQHSSKRNDDYRQHGKYFESQSQKALREVRTKARFKTAISNCSKKNRFCTLDKSARFIFVRLSNPKFCLQSQPYSATNYIRVLFLFLHEQSVSHKSSPLLTKNFHIQFVKFFTADIKTNHVVFRH